MLHPIYCFLLSFTFKPDSLSRTVIIGTNLTKLVTLLITGSLKNLWKKLHPTTFQHPFSFRSEKSRLERILKKLSIEIEDCLPDERHARTRSKIKIQNPLDIFLARVSPIFPQFLICEIKRNSGGTVVTLAIQTARRLFAGQTWQRSINWRWCKSDVGNQTVENCQVGGERKQGKHTM